MQSIAIHWIAIGWIAIDSITIDWIAGEGQDGREGGEEREGREGMERRVGREGRERREVGRGIAVEWIAMDCKRFDWGFSIVDR